MALVAVEHKQPDGGNSVADAPEQHADMAFISYNDDGDYALLAAKKGDSTFSFVNNDNEDRSLNRGDLIAVSWKTGTITLAGDGEAPVKAELITSVKKTVDGPVTKFRKGYGKKLKYTWAPEANYSQYYLDKVYLQVEYYLANTKNQLLQLHISKKDDLTYSIEQQTKNNREYTMIGIAAPSEHNSSIVQWLYLNNEDDRIYEYDLANDKLVLFD